MPDSRCVPSRCGGWEGGKGGGKKNPTAQLAPPPSRPYYTYCSSTAGWVPYLVYGVPPHNFVWVGGTAQNGGQLRRTGSRWRLAGGGHQRLRLRWLLWLAGGSNRQRRALGPVQEAMASCLRHVAGFFRPR